MVKSIFYSSLVNITVAGGADAYKEYDEPAEKAPVIWRHMTYWVQYEVDVVIV